MKRATCSFVNDTLLTLLLRFVNILIISDIEERQCLQCCLEQIGAQRPMNRGGGGAIQSLSLSWACWPEGPHAYFMFSACEVVRLWRGVLHHFISVGIFVSSNPLLCMSKATIGQKWIPHEYLKGRREAVTITF